MAGLPPVSQASHVVPIPARSLRCVFGPGWASLQAPPEGFGSDMETNLLEVMKSLVADTVAWRKKEKKPEPLLPLM